MTNEMTKQEQIEILRRIGNTASMKSNNDLNDLCNVIIEMEMEIETVKNERRSCIDRLVNGNGDWILIFTYNNFGDNVLLLLPNHRVGDDELPERQAIINLISDWNEWSIIIDDFMKDRPDQPFIIKGETLIECVDIMSKKLSKLIIDDDFSKFTDEDEMFSALLKLANRIEIDLKSDGNLLWTVMYHKWINFINTKEDSSYE